MLGSIQAVGLKDPAVFTGNHRWVVLEITETSNQVLVGHTAMDLVALGQRADKEQCAAEEPETNKKKPRTWDSAKV